MKNLKPFLFFSLILFSSICKAQNDDMTDTRRKTESYARFHYGTLRADLATFTLAGTSESVGAPPLKKIDYSALNDSSITFQGDGIKAIVKIAPFNAAKNKLYYDGKYVIKIDRRTYYGDYGNVPNTYISDVSLIVNHDTVLIPKIVYSDLFNLHFTYSDKGVQRTRDAVYFSNDGHYIYLYLFCKNNSGSYEVTWIFQDNKYLRRVLDYDLF